MNPSNKVDHNTEKWTAFCKNEEEAENILRNFVSKLAEKKLIVSAKKELISDKKPFQNLFPFKFVIITAPKNES